MKIRLLLALSPLVLLPGAIGPATNPCFGDGLSVGPGTVVKLAFTVPDEATLEASSTLILTSGVWRRDFAAGDGAPPLFYLPSGSPCSLNGGNGDKGSQVKSSDGKCWLAQFPPAGIDIREFGASTTASDITNETAELAAAAAAYTSNLPLIIAGGTQSSPNLPWATGAQLYRGMRMKIAPGTCVQATTDGPMFGTLPSPGSALGHTNGDNIIVEGGCYDLNRHHGTAFLNRAGLSVQIKGQPTVKNVIALSYTDNVGGQTATGTTTNNSATITGLSNIYGQVWAVGDIVTDSLGCIPANDQVAAATSNSITLGSNANASGCGTNDVLTFTHVLPDAAFTWLGVNPLQGAYYQGIDGPISDERISATSSAHTSSTITVDNAAGIAAMKNVSITNAVFNQTGTTPKITYTLSATPSPLIAAGQYVCVDGITPSAYNICGPAARGTLYDTVVITAAPNLNPAAYSSGGFVRYGGSFMVDASGAGQGLPANTYVTSIAGNVLTISGSGPTGSWVDGDVITATTGGIGALFTSNGDTNNPNATNLTGGELMGYMIGAEIYQGGDQNVMATDLSYDALAVVAGGNGDSNSATVSGPIQVRLRLFHPFVEGQMSGHAVLLTADSAYACMGLCADGFASYSAPGDPSALTPVVNWGLHNSYGAATASTSASPMNPGITAAASELMMGLGKDDAGAGAHPCTITPVVSGKVRFQIQGLATNDTAGDGAQVVLREIASGVVPGQGDPVTGTELGAALPLSGIGTQKIPFSLDYTVSGLNQGSAYPFDISLKQVGGGNASISQVSCSATEVR